MRAVNETSGAAVAAAVAELLEPRRAALLEELAELVALDSPSDDLTALARAADWLQQRFAQLGEVMVSQTADGRRHLVLATPGADARSPLLLCHYDTVWPVGTAAERPLRIDGSVAHGAGVLDMKASILCAGQALFALRELGVPHAARLSLSADEEIGNHASRARIEALARDAVAALVLEPPLPGGVLKTARKGHAHGSCGRTAAPRTPASPSRRAPARWLRLHTRSFG